MEIAVATETDVEHVARALRPADQREVEALGFTNPTAVLHRCFRESAWSEVIRLDGMPAAVYGLGRTTGAAVGLPWMLATPAADSFGVAFIRGCRPVVVRMLAERPALVNFVHADNIKAQRWIAWLGFRFDRPLLIPTTKAKFYPFFASREGSEPAALAYIDQARQALMPHRLTLQQAVAAAVQSRPGLPARARRNPRLGATMES